MNRKFSIWAVTFSLIMSVPSAGYGYESVLVRADDSQEILQDNTTPKGLNEELSNFLRQNRILTVEDYARWLEKNIRYQSVTVEGDWKSWQDTLTRGYGDCKNISVLNSKILETLGYTPVLIGYKHTSGDTWGHLFTAFYKDGRLNIFDNINYYATPLTRLDQIAAYLVDKYNADKVFEVNLTAKTTSLLASRESLALGTR